jgi:hypothetical protein
MFAGRWEDIQKGNIMILKDGGKEDPINGLTRYVVARIKPMRGRRVRESLKSVSTTEGRPI